MINLQVSYEKISLVIVKLTRNLPSYSLDQFRKLDLSGVGWIHIEDFPGQNVDQLIRIVRYVRQVVDPSRRIKVSTELEQPIPQVAQLMNEDFDLFFISRDFAVPMLNCSKPEQVFNVLPFKLANKRAKVIVPWGSEGARGLDMATGQVCESRAYPPTGGVVDTLGAGDTFIGASIFAAHVLGLDLQGVISYGCRVAGAKVGIDGYDELDQFGVRKSL